MSFLGLAGSIGSSLLGGLFGSSANKSANETNLRIAQMNNEFNERMLDKQQQYNRAMYDKQWSDTVENQWNMWNANNDYNTAAEQRRRLEEAGLNPNMMMNGGSAGVAQGAGASAPSALGVNPPSASQVSVQPFAPSPYATSIGRSIGQYMDYMNNKKVSDAQSAKLASETAGINIENQYRAQKLMSEIDNNNSDSRKKGYEGDLARLQYLFNFRNFSTDSQQKRQDLYNSQQMAQLVHAQTISEQLRGALSWKELRYFDQEAQARLASAAATAYSLYAQGAMSYSASQMYVKNAIKAEEETKGIKIDNNVKKKTQEALIRGAYHSSNQAYWDFVHSMNNSGPDTSVQRLNQGKGWLSASLRGIQNAFSSIPLIPFGFAVGSGFNSPVLILLFR